MFNLMKVEHFCDGLECWQAKPRTDLGLRAASDEELDIGDLVYIFGEYKQNGRLRIWILALIQSINDEGLDLCCLEWANNESFHL